MGIRGVILSCLFAAVALAISGCQTKTDEPASGARSPGSSAPAPTATPGSGATPTPAATPAPPAIDPTCMSNAGYNACIFWKNPVAHTQNVFSPRITPTTNLDAVQTYGVWLTGLDATGYLQNSSFRVFPASGMTRVRKNAQGNWKHKFSSCSGGSCTADASHLLGQVMTYYSLQHTLEEFEARTGKFYAKAKNIGVITYVANLFNAYWDGASIYLGDGGVTKTEFSISSEVTIHELGHANLQFASPLIQPQSDYCATANGCIDAIHEGQADYHVAILFPEHGVAIGETAMNSLDGIVEAGIIRTISANRDLTAQQAYDVTPDKGEVHLMGRVYASMWWEVRSAPGSVAAEVDRLFTEHLPTLRTADTFITAVDKIKAVDAALFAGKYSPVFTAELSRRGL